ncbi:unnamed protein product [Mytilus coruscus]|uniref:Tyr recombinase domain-containing protein n=1 Tax=Mytilus coruscus TaxID=42192 RepID=A0A6J8E6R2_MYTCO|nr:unnamed protein product [Mytilus coruscus]
MCEEGGIQGRNTNHSVKKTAITALVHEDIPDTRIMQLSGHKNVQSINSYSSASIEQRIDEDRGEIVSIPTVIIQQQKSAQSDKSGSIAAGTGTSMIVVIVVISVLILIHRRRLSNEKTTCQESQSSGRIKDKVDGHINNKTPQPVVYHEIVSPHTGKLKYPQTVNNIAYDYAHSNCTPQLQNVKQSANNSIQAHTESNQLNNKAFQKGYEMAKVQNVTRDCSESVMASNYCLAKPISSNTEDESDPYAINRDYDHLDNVK